MSRNSTTHESFFPGFVVVVLFPTGSKLLRVEAQDRDEVGSPNSVIDYDIKSVSPNTQDVEFSINGSGSISFKGCLDREASFRTEALTGQERPRVVKIQTPPPICLF